MLILPDAGLVFLAMPKTGTMAMRAMLRRHAWAGVRAGRHTGMPGYRRRIAAEVEAAFGRPFETLAAVREPVDRLHSWYRYRQRDEVAATPASSRGMDFDAFVAAVVGADPPEFARVGRQDVFVGWDGAAAGVDHLFDYARLPDMVAFLADRLSVPLVLPLRNVSPPGPSAALSPGVEARLRIARAGEFALHDAVARAGHLRRG